MKILRVCQHCGKDFIAQRTTTQSCSDHCAKMYYKTKKRNEKIAISNKETLIIKAKPLEEIKSKDFLTVKDAAKLLNCSVRTLYRLIDNGTIRAVNLSERKITIKRADIDVLFTLPQTI
ncbi:MAG: helix-turn-helix domain-containing protein [Bacteroidetes bacterium]|nr:helix-turn-helix domain-containing protein [Bacteroidota bacterium]